MLFRSLVFALTVTLLAIQPASEAQAKKPARGPSSKIDLPPCPIIPPDPNAPVPPPPPPREVLADEEPLPDPAPAKKESSLKHYHQGAIWKKIPGSQSWTEAALEVVQNRREDFEQARDIETFCPGYVKATQAQRDICWLRLIGAIAEHESGLKPNPRPFCEGNGIYSVGLLALSTGECPNAMTMEELQDPAESLICALNRMAKLIKRDHYIEGKDKTSGASAYWSTLRTPYKAVLPDGRKFTLGKRDEVISRTKTFHKY